MNWARVVGKARARDSIATNAPSDGLAYNFRIVEAVSPSGDTESATSSRATVAGIGPYPWTSAAESSTPNKDRSDRTTLSAIGVGSATARPVTRSTRVSVMTCA